MNTLKGQKLAEGESENGKKLCDKNGKKNIQNFWKNRVCFRRNIPPYNPAGRRQIKLGRKRKSMRVSVLKTASEQKLLEKQVSGKTYTDTTRIK